MHAVLVLLGSFTVICTHKISGLFSLMSSLLIAVCISSKIAMVNNLNSIKKKKKGLKKVLKA